MKYIMKPAPILCIVPFILFVITTLDVGFSNFVKEILLIYILLFLTLFLHEFGHFLGGLFSSCQLLNLTVGPFSIIKSNNKYKSTFNNEWAYIGGITNISINDLYNDLNVKGFRIAFWGPLTTFFVTIFSFITYLITDNEYILYFAYMNLAIFVATLIPYNVGGLYSDGYQCIKFWLKDPRFQGIFLISKYLTSETPPNRWPNELTDSILSTDLNQSKGMELCTLTMYIFYSEVSKGKYKNIDNFFKKVEVNNLAEKKGIYENTILCYFIASQFLNKKTLSDTVKNLANEISNVDKVSRIRTNILMNKNLNKRKKLMHDYETLIRNHIEGNLGFWKAEYDFYLKLSNEFLG